MDGGSRMVVIDSLKLFLKNLFISKQIINICDITRIGIELIIILSHSCYLRSYYYSRV